jgi:hypothetical protein
LGEESEKTGLSGWFCVRVCVHSGGITEGFDKEFPALHSTATEQLHLLWIAYGTDDRLIDINHKFREWLASTLSTWTSRRPARIGGWFGCGT